jgi:hypothetical protein
MDVKPLNKDKDEDGVTKNHCAALVSTGENCSLVSNGDNW